jgi:methyl-accepting chemotaxis protein
MKWFGNLKMAAKLLISFFIIAAMGAAMGVFAIINLDTISTSDTQLYENMLVPMEQIADIANNFQEQRISLQQIVIADTVQDIDREIEKIEQYQTESDGLIKEFEATILSDRMHQLFDAFQAAKETFRPLMNEVISLAQSGRQDEAMALLAEDGEVTLAATAEMDAIDDILTAKMEDANDKAESNQSQSESVILITTIIIGVVILASILIGVLISRIISRPLKKLSDAAITLSDGNTDIELDIADTKDEIGVLAQSFKQILITVKGLIADVNMLLDGAREGQLVNRADEQKHKGDFRRIIQGVNEIIGTLNDVLLEINTAAEQVATGTTQVSTGSQAISQGAAEQASSIEELTASIQQFAEQTALNAENSNKANGLSISAKNSAAEGNEKMKNLQNAMQDINESSSNISKIIKVIDDIAFQTNMLALNAAVEAARAGVHGKGFAVVAEEVRNLAARSANAAKETTMLIEGSIKKTEAGTAIANETAASLLDIVTSVEKAEQLVGEITTASNEQAAGIAQVNQGIEQLSQVVQTNSATAQEAAAASEELSGQAELLKNMVGRFQLKTGQKTAKPGGPSISAAYPLDDEAPVNESRASGLAPEKY